MDYHFLHDDILDKMHNHCNIDHDHNAHIFYILCMDLNAHHDNIYDISHIYYNIYHAHNDYNVP